MTLPRALLVSLRPHQWIKNLVVFAALAFSKHLFEPDAALRAVAAFAIFCALAGAAYLVNDVLDAEQDRQHPVKRLRPVASGALPARVARAATVVLAVAVKKRVAGEPSMRFSSVESLFWKTPTSAGALVTLFSLNCIHAL